MKDTHSATLNLKHLLTRFSMSSGIYDAIQNLEKSIAVCFFPFLNHINELTACASMLD